MNKFSKMSKMSHSVAVYVPSNNNGVVYDNSQDVRKFQAVMSSLFGGASAVKVQGAWLSDTQGLVLEDTVKVYAFAEKLEDAYLDVIHYLTEETKKERGQDAIGVEIDGEFYLV